MPARLFAVALSAVAVVSLAACGGNDDKTRVRTSTADTASAAAPAATTASSTAEQPTAVPTAAELLPTIQALIDPSTSVQSKVSAIVGGQGLEPTFTKLAAAMKQIGPEKITFKVSNIKLNGVNAVASVDISNSGKSLGQLCAAVWQQQNGSWALTRAGACSIIPPSGVTCPGAAVK